MDQIFCKEYDYIIGCDEVGRGPIAGPVVGCAVKIRADKKLISKLRKMQLNDSKTLSSKKRIKILEALEIDIHKIKTKKIHKAIFEIEFVVWELDNEIIDEINILNASLLCMSRSAQKLYNKQSIVLIDGNQNFRDVILNSQSVIKGDSKSIAIAMASIIAKEFRDEKMKLLDGLYPGYGLASHAGYPTKMHKEMVATLGVTPIHRKTFRGVSEHVH